MLGEAEFLVTDTKENIDHKITVTRNEENRVEINGLPNKLGAFLINFTDKELAESTLDVINTLITMYDARGNGRI